MTVGGVLLLALFFRAVAGASGTLAGWTIGAVALAILLRTGLTACVAAATCVPSVQPAPRQVNRPAERLILPSAAQIARQHVLHAGGGAYLGLDAADSWVTADPESAVIVLGPPRSSKTSAIIVPAVMSASGAVLSTSTKPDVMRATLRARSEIGQPWLFDPSGESGSLPGGVRRLCWSPVAVAGTWDDALAIARAMTATARPASGTTNESHWSERAAALLAPLLYAANLTNRPIEQVLRWVLRNYLADALEILADDQTPIAADVLLGIERTDGRERSSIFSATAGVLAAYNSDAARATAKMPNFDATAFARSSDTIYITAPEHKQALCAPLIVGLLEEIRHAAYENARNTPQSAEPPMLWVLDEFANTAPIRDPTALVSQAGGQRIQLIVSLQDLSQARERWSDATADAFMSLFQTKLILNGIGDSRTLESISLALGEYDRHTVSHSLGRSDPQEFMASPTYTETVSHQTQRQRVLTPGDIAGLPAGHALHLTGANWGLLRLTRYYEHEPWATVAGVGRQRDGKRTRPWPQRSEV